MWTRGYRGSSHLQLLSSVCQPGQVTELGDPNLFERFLGEADHGLRRAVTCIVQEVVVLCKAETLQPL